MRLDDLVTKLRDEHGIYLPQPVIDIYRGRLDNNPSTVLIAEAERFAVGLKDIVDSRPDIFFTLTTSNFTYAEIMCNEFDLYDNVKVLVADIYSYEFIDKKFDLIFASPVFGSRTLIEDSSFICRETEMVALENLSLHLNGGGNLLINLPGRITFASGRVGDLRNFIQSNYKIKEISSLPEGTFEFTGIKIYLLDIENSRPDEEDDITIRKYASGERKNRRSTITSLNVAEDTFVMLSELDAQGDWNIERVFAQQDEEFLKYNSSSIRKELLGNVADVFRGKAITQKVEAGTIAVINITNIGEYELNVETLDRIEEEERKVANYMLQEGDVLLPARGTAIRVCVFKKQEFPCIASSNVVVIRPNGKLLNSVYLKVFLDSPIGNKMINSFQQGASIMNISYKDLKSLEIPMPDIEKQMMIASEYIEQLEQYQNAIKDANEKWQKVLEKLQTY